MLEQLGWSMFFARSLQACHCAGGRPGRVAFASRDHFVVLTAAGDVLARPAGSLRHNASILDWPVTGDWVVLRPNADVIEAVLPRRSAFIRKEPGEVTREQVLSANIDVLLLVSGLDGDLNMRRIERYLTLAIESGAQPVVVLNKADLDPDTAGSLERVRSAAPGVPAIAVSAATGQGMEALDEWLRPQSTAAFAGSSGVGKSTLINRLLGTDIQATRETRQWDSRGRHTTTERRLFLAPGGWLLIDMPGLRELQLWATQDSADEAFADIAELARLCQFRDCSHEREPGCLVRDAIEHGRLEPNRLANYLKLQREIDRLDRRTDQRAAWLARRNERRLHRQMRKLFHKRT
jgi:ribosome biogenesis GTPase